MRDNMPDGVAGWVDALSAAEVPVLARTVREIAKLRQREDEVTAREISAVVLHDPLLTLRVLRHIESRRRPGQPADITTIEHALMMMGASPFFKSCEHLVTVESRLSGNAPAVAGFMNVLSRAHHAAVYARSWAAYRHDVESDEVIVATLLRDLAEMLLWCTAPAAAIEIQVLLKAEPGLRSADAQHRVLGIKLHELQLALCAAWKLPGLLRDLMDDAHANAPRVKNVALAVAVARHSAHGWHDPALPDDYAEIARFLKLPLPEASERVARLAFAAANTDNWYGVAGTASMLPPLIRYDQADPPRGIANALERAQEKLLGVLLAVLPTCNAAAASPQAMTDARQALLAATVRTLLDDLGLPRGMFAAAAEQAGGTSGLNAAAAAGTDSEPLMKFCIDTVEPNLFGRLLENRSSIWVSRANREALLILLPDTLQSQLGADEFIAAAVSHDGVSGFGVLYADRGRDSGGIDLAANTAFKCLARFLGTCLAKLQEAMALDIPRYRLVASQPPPAPAAQARTG